MQPHHPPPSHNNNTNNTTLHNTYGNDITNPPPTQCIRIAFQNINGIERWPNPAEEVISAMKTNHINIFSCAETNCNWTPEFKTAVEASMTMEFGSNKLSTSSRYTIKPGYQPGGVMTTSVGGITKRITQQGQDRMGRFSWILIKGQNRGGLVIITAYRVSQKKGDKSGQDTSHYNQKQALYKEGELTPDPRNKLLQDLTTLITTHRNKGHEIMLNIDANESWAEPNSKLQTFMTLNDLNDTHHKLLTTLPTTTRQGSKQRIDYMLTTPGALNATKQCGIRSLHEGIISDHVMLFTDIDINHIIGSQIPQIVPPTAREFSYDNTKMRLQFMKELHKIHTHQNIPTRIKEICAQLQHAGPTKTIVKRYNKIDYEIICSIKAAAKKTVKRSHGYDRSPTLTEAGSAVLFWKSLYHSKTNQLGILPRTESLASLANENLTQAQHHTINDTKKLLQKAKLHLRDCQRNATELRKQWLESVARWKATNDGDTTAAQTLKIMIQKLQNKQMHLKLSRISKGPRGALDYIEIPTHDWYYSPKTNELYHYDNGVFETHANRTTSIFYKHHSLKVPPDDTSKATVRITPDSIILETLHTDKIEWTRIDNKTAMESLLLRRNKRHYQQMEREESLPSERRIKELLKDHGTSSNADRILDGDITKDIKSFPKIIRLWFQQFKRSDKEKTLPTITGWITTAEYKAAFKSVKEKTSSSPSGINYTLWKCIANDDTANEYMATMLSLPFVYGFKHDRWSKCLDVMLEKKPGVRKIHMLRIIGLVEADFNTALKLYFARKLTQNAEQTALTNEQWGGRPNRNAIDTALRKQLTLDYGRAMYVTIALFMADMTACFDRMVPNISSIIAQKYGMEKSILQCRNKVMESMEHAVRTSHGDSDATYKQLPNEPAISGETQGKGDVASLWSIESHTLLKTHSETCSGITLHHAYNNTTMQKNVDAFVDDADAVSMATDTNLSNREKTATKNMQTDAQAWSEVISACGGSLAPHKCKWQAQTWDYTKCPPEMNPHPTGEIYLRDNKGATTKITKIDSTSPNVGLGCRIAPDGNQTQEYNHRLEQCQEAARRTSKACLNIQETYSMLLQRIIPKTTYSMGITSFTKKQCSTLNTIIDEVILPKLNINRHTPKAAIYGTLCRAGLQYPSYEIIQDQKNILLLLQQLKYSSIINNDILVLLSAHQVTSGLTTPILEDTTTTIPYLSKGWIPHTRSRMGKIQATMWIEHQWSPQLQRTNDTSIMKQFHRIPNITNTKLEHANYVRMYLRITTIADLANINGNLILAGRMTGRWRADTNIKTWPTIPRPPESHWATFRWCMRKTFLTKTNVNLCTNTVQLDISLGAWLPVPRNTKYTTYRTHDKAYRRTGKGFIEYTNPTCSHLFTINKTTLRLPLNSHPIESSHDTTELWTSHQYNTLPLTPQPPTKTHTTKPHDGQQRAGSDASVNPINGESSCAYTVRIGNQSITGSERYQQSQYMTSYRAELQGIRCTLLAIQEMEATQITQGCDNKAAVKAVNRKYLTPKQMLDPEMDLIMNIHKIIETSKSQVDIKWVKGHQDETTQKHNLDIDSIINIEMDELANNARQSGIPICQTHPYQHSGAMLKINNEWVTTKHREQILHAITTPRHREYWAKKYPTMDPMLYDTINWTFIGKARKRMTRTENISIMKLMNGWLNVGRQKGHFGLDSNCPCCDQTEETHLHLFTCQNQHSKTTRHDALRALEKYYHTHKVPAGIAMPLIELLRSTSEGQNATHKTTPSTAVENAITQQLKLGPDLLFKGYMTTSWIDAIKDHAKTNIDKIMVHIILGLWRAFFKPVWAYRNTILHDDTNFVTQRYHRTLTNDLLEWKRKSKTLLHHTQQVLLDYTTDEIARWTIPTKQLTLSVLSDANKAFKKYKQHIQTGTHTLDHFWGPP